MNPSPLLLSNYFEGEFREVVQAEGEFPIASPADLRDQVARFRWSTQDVPRAIESAERALKAWRRRSPEERFAFLRAYRDALKGHAEEIADAIAREVGKALWEARAEVQSMVAKVDLSLGEALAWTTERHLPEIHGEIRYRPLGVVAVIGPFNFPGHLPNGQIVPALALGNCVVFKPSEKTPTTAYWMARCMHEAGLPKGVFNLIQGGVEVAQTLLQSPALGGVLFTGSAAVGREISRISLDHPGRLVALELGGKNASIVLGDCDLERTLRNLAFSAFATTGQRCTATSRLYVESSIAERVIEGLSRITRELEVGHPKGGHIFMGPLISEASRERWLAALSKAEQGGYQALVPGSATSVEGHEGWYVRPALHIAPHAAHEVEGYSDEELFAPDLALYLVHDLDEAIARSNASRFGLVASIYTARREAFDEASRELEVGLLHWNRPTTGASSRLPFGGLRASGNHRPAGILAGAFCADPVALLHADPTAAPPQWPGMR